MTAFFPSLISADLMHLADDIEFLEPHCEGFHVDVMDFQFVPNLTWGPMFVNAIRATTHKTIWVDLLVEHPEKYISLLHLREGDMVSIHYESSVFSAHPELVDGPSFKESIFSDIKRRGWLPGIAIDPRTNVAQVEPFLSHVHHLLLMSVVPGFSGQPFLPLTRERLHAAKQLMEKTGARVKIALDGGINEATWPTVAPFGVDFVAVGSGIFSAPDQLMAIDSLRKAGQK